MLDPSQQERLERILAQTDLPQIAQELGVYFKALRGAGFKRDEAFGFVSELHAYLCDATFDRPDWAR